MTTVSRSRRAVDQTPLTLCSQMNKTEVHSIESGVLARAQGCLLGQLAGDALGSLVEFQTPGQILQEYPDGVRDLADGGTWNTIAGQPTDDSELALSLARVLVRLGRYDAREAWKAYVSWLNSEPFDCGATIAGGLRGHPNLDSQANGAMMRISPLGIFGARHALSDVAEWAQQDAALTHPNPVCQQANALFAMAIADAVRSARSAAEVHHRIAEWAKQRDVDALLLDVIRTSASFPPTEYIRQQGWVLIAFHNALWQLLHASTLEEAVVDTVIRGGDTDTNAAICGTLLGAVHGREAIPARWTECLRNCCPSAGQAHVFRPRPQRFWPVDALELAESLIR